MTFMWMTRSVGRRTFKELHRRILERSGDRVTGHANPRKHGKNSRRGGHLFDQQRLSHPQKSIICPRVASGRVEPSRGQRSKGMVCQGHKLSVSEIKVRTEGFLSCNKGMDRATWKEIDDSILKFFPHSKRYASPRTKRALIPDVLRWT